MAYDIKALGEKLKAKGLDLAEEALVVVANETLDWVQESAAASENKWDDMVSAFIPIAKPMIMEQIDKIDGEVG